MQEIQIDKGINRMKKTYRNKCRKIFRNSVIVLNGTLLFVLMIPFCALLVMIDVVWLIMDGMVRTLEMGK